MAPFSAAQPRSAEFFGLAGISRVAGDEGSLGTGLGVGGALHAPLMRRLAFDLDVTWTSASRDIGGVPDVETTQTLVNPSLVYRWGSDRVYAFAGGGAGFQSAEVREQFDDNMVTFNVKGGVVARIRGRLLFRADILTAWRFVLPHVQARAGVGYRF